MKVPSLRSGKAKVVAAVAALAVVGGGSLLYIQAQEARKPEVQLTTARTSRITNSVVAVADIEAGNRNTITLSPSVKVVDVLVEEGQRVARGDLVAVLDTSEYASQLEQQGITLADAESTLGYLSGPSATGTNATGRNAVSQARVALENARAAEAAARRNLADAPGLSSVAVRQAEIGVEGARLNVDVARTNADAARDLNDNAVRQAEIALDIAEDASDRAASDLSDLKERLQDGLITHAEYDAQRPALEAAADRAQNACRSAQVALDTARVSEDTAVALADKAVKEADLAVASAEATLDEARKRAGSSRKDAQQAVSDAQRAVRSASIALANAQAGATAARAGDSERVSNQRSQVDLLDANIRYLVDKVEQGRLRAAVDGVVTRMDAVENHYPEQGDAIVVEGTSGYVAAVDVGQSDSAGLKPGQRATVTLKGIGTTFQGSVASVAAVAEKSATSSDRDPKVGVEVSVLDPDDTIRIGFEADVEILLEDKEGALQIGVDAVRSEPGTGRKYVFVVGEDRVLTRVFIATGIESADSVEVLEGLVDGQDCVLDPDDDLADGLKVRIAGGGR